MAHIEEAERFAQLAPPLNLEEQNAINALFPTYIFRRSKTSEIWTTCCHTHMTVSNEDMRRVTPERNFPVVMWTPHQREPKNRWQEAPQTLVTCPLCGAPAIVKELGRTGGRENLSRYRRAVVLRWHEGALWARAYDCGKHYGKKKGYSLTGEPKCKLVGVYRFQPGLAEGTTRYFWNDAFTDLMRQDRALTQGRWNIKGPFNANAEYGVGYNVVGLEEIQKSPFRYCMAVEAVNKTDKFLQFLTACCFYPRQIEMLMKTGMLDVVFDLTERAVKHAAVINWEEPDPMKAFGLDRQEMKTFLGTSRDIQILELYKRLKKRVPMVQCEEWVSRGININGTFRAAKKWNLSPEKLIRYLNGNVGCARYGGMSGLEPTLHFWADYTTAAEAVGYPLHRENVLLPRNLGAAHDEAAKRHREQLERQWKAEQEKRDRAAAADYGKLRLKLEKKYSFAMEGYVIRVPAGKDEILEEGRKLQHCVSGYADRHIAGMVTILFMRKAAQRTSRG